MAAQSSVSHITARDRTRHHTASGAQQIAEKALPKNKQIRFNHDCHLLVQLQLLHPPNKLLAQGNGGISIFAIPAQPNRKM